MPEATTAGRAARPAPGRRMERNEQLATLAAAVLSVAAGVGFLAAYLLGKRHGHTSSTAVAIYTAGDFVFSAVLLLAARSRSRFAAGMVAVVGGFLLWGSTAISFPYLLLAAWLLMRNSRSLRAERDAARAGGATGARSKPGASRPASGGGLGGLLGRRRRPANSPGEVRRPSASKRYTPPRPPSKDGRKR